MDEVIEYEHLKTLTLAHRKFHQVLKNLAAYHSDAQVIEQLTGIIEELFPNKVGSILMVDNQSQTLHSSDAKTKLPDFYSEGIEGTPIGPNASSCGAAAYSRDKCIVSDTFTDPNWEPFLDVLIRAQLRSCWSMPIISKNDRVLGTFSIFSPVIAEPEDYELEILETATHVASLALDRKEMMKTACTDPLTLLSNRYLFEQSLELIMNISKRDNRNLSVVYLDLNRYVQVRELIGSHAGDDVLRLTAQSIQQELRNTDISCRYEDDEFVFAALDTSTEDLFLICERIRKSTLGKLSDEIMELGFGLTFGGIISNSRTGYDFHDLIRLADEEMYLARANPAHISIRDLTGQATEQVGTAE
ncbi:sensor domain-containing diguanylate cyclase [Motiliproteus sp.]|uniref:sensor domain-containing diguanylate cyclase n=1 Tax=Motiliproteus sp. TaxID=1898955 RepID=UPI003BAD80DA